MNDSPVLFKSEGLSIEGRLGAGDMRKAVLISHPHPQYGGNMQNPVVQSITAVYQKKGYTSLRYNFRGVGKSQGAYGKGRGELRDLLAAFAFLQAKGFSEIDLAGYSFGAWVTALAAGKIQAGAVILVAPPAAMMDFSQTGAISALKLVLAGSEDEFAPPQRVEPLIRRWNPEARFSIIRGADHFFFGYLDELTAQLAAAVTRAAG